MHCCIDWCVHAFLYVWKCAHIYVCVNYVCAFMNLIMYVFIVVLLMCWFMCVCINLWMYWICAFIYLYFICVLVFVCISLCINLLNSVFVVDLCLYGLMHVFIDYVHLVIYVFMCDLIYALIYVFMHLFIYLWIY